MKKYILLVIWLVIFALSGFYSYRYGTLVYSNCNDIKIMVELLAYVFIAGVSISALIYSFIFSNTAASLNEYKRELEKESIGKTENSSRIKVLESKIKVLEKALDDALKK